ncbi:hypothetical protein ACH42_06170 [Endozoicomonas sp. (ex Bugula neritina AB1)]|nr:hypothetical protein ACH42_06170 [Endozoicomonas sp. (ex Bugula neritina AB1)]
MIIFTVTNKTTSQVYVGSTRNDLVDQWEKMVAAAEQNLDYPLYQEIRSHGRDGFTVEEWDYVDDRGELAALEQEALEIFGAKSLRGYKTSTVKIQPKKKTRTRKSNIEKELASIFAEVASEAEDDATPPSLTVKSSTDIPAEIPKTPRKKPVTPSASTPLTKPKEQYTQAEIDRLTQTVANAKKKDEPKEVTASVIPDNCSQANAVVQMNNINLSDDITAQLAAIQAAADAVLSGDTNSATNLVKEPKVAAEEPKIATVIAIPEPEPEPVIELSPKELRIREAIERHRKARAQKTSDRQSEERKQIAMMLTELHSRALSLGNNVNIAA